jgi:hypothetical protein
MSKHSKSTANTKTEGIKKNRQRKNKNTPTHILLLELSIFEA